ncbi:MAG: hypothetical protein ACRECQ_01395 [Burkholderiaceae bacterium]
MSNSARGLPLWPLPLLAGALPAIATLIALWLSIHLELVPACNPFLEGCVSVSRAARHDLPNYIFRVMVLPAVALQALTWLLCRTWLIELGAPRGRWLRHLAWIGIIAAVSLAIYGAFLGTEGRTYRWLRQYGTILYFGFTGISMLIAGDAIHRIASIHKVLTRFRADLALFVMLIVMLLAGLSNKFVAPWFSAEVADRIENVAEWWAAAMLSFVFVVLAWLWRQTDYRARTSVG